MLQIEEGPSGLTGWERRTSRSGGAPVTLLLLPDATREELRYYLPEVPLLARDEDGRPVLTLTLLLQRAPSPEEASIHGLIQQGLLSFDVTLAAPPESLPRGDGTYRPLFAREVELTLEAASGPLPGARALSSGVEARAALSMSLGRDETLAVLAALEGGASGLTVRARVTYRAVGPARTARLEGTWAGVHDFLASRAGPEGRLDLATLRQHFGGMLREGVLSVVSAGGEPLAHEAWDSELAALFSSFQGLAGAVVLRRESPGLEPMDPDNTYALRSRPHPLFNVGLWLTLSGDELRSVELAAPLERVLGGALEGLPREAYIHLLSPGPANGHGHGLEPVPRRVTTSRPSSRSAREPARAAALQLVTSRGFFAPLVQKMRPDPKRPLPSSLLAGSDVARPVLTPGKDPVWVVNDGKPGTGLRSLPVISRSSPRDGPWPDRLRPMTRWVPPRFALVFPTQEQTPDSSPFRFTFLHKQATAKRKRSLRGILRVTLRQMDPLLFGLPARSIVAPPNPLLNPPKVVPIFNTVASIVLPYVDPKTGRREHKTFLGTTRRRGDKLEVTVHLDDEWARLCYGVLSRGGSPEWKEQATLRLSYSYQAYTPLRDAQARLAVGGKTARIPVAFSSADVPSVITRPVLDATRRSLLLPRSEVRFLPEAHGAGVSALRRRRPLRPGPLRVRPELESPPEAKPRLRESRYLQQTHVREARVLLSFPCTTPTYAGLYLEETRAIGCDDRFLPDALRSEQYERLADLDHEQYTVYSSRQQHSRFLVVPTRYVLTRFAPSDPRGYRPTLLVYSSVDPDEPRNNQAVILATLEPDLPPYLRRALLARLTEYASEPVIEYPTELWGQTSYSWAISGSLAPDTLMLPECFQVSLTTNLTQLRVMLDMIRISGLSGSVRFKLPDGMELQSLLRLHLPSITGPWATGPLEVSMEAGQARLTNRIDRTVSLSELVLYLPSGDTQRVPVESTLAPGESRSVPLPAAPRELYPVYTPLPPSTPAMIEEIRSFAEDIMTNVIFLNQINFSRHGLRSLEVKARIAEVEGTYTASLSHEAPVASVDMVLPLTTFLEQRLLRFQVTKTFDSGSTATTGWLDWNLETQGHIVGLEWELIA